MAFIDKKYHKLLQHILDDGFRYEDPNRKGVYRLRIPDYKIVHNFNDGFPAITTKQLYWKGVVGELLWILRGEQNIKYLVDNDINIWSKDAFNYWYKKQNNKPTMRVENYISKLKHFPEIGNIGRGYGAQLRSWSDEGKSDGISPTLDQFSELINTLKSNPMATKKTVTFWNPAEKDQCALTPCHWSFEILVEPLSRTELIMKLWEGKSVSDMDFKNPNPNKNISRYKFTLKWHQHSVDTFLGKM